MLCIRVALLLDPVNVVVHTAIFKSGDVSFRKLKCVTEAACHQASSWVKLTHFTYQSFWLLVAGLQTENERTIQVVSSVSSTVRHLTGTIRHMKHN